MCGHDAKHKINRPMVYREIVPKTPPGLEYWNKPQFFGGMALYNTKGHPDGLQTQRRTQTSPKGGSVLGVYGGRGVLCVPLGRSFFFKINPRKVCRNSFTSLLSNLLRNLPGTDLAPSAPPKSLGIPPGSIPQPTRLQYEVRC